MPAKKDGEFSEIAPYIFLKDVEIDSGELDASAFDVVSFKIPTTLASDHIELHVKMTDSDSFSALEYEGSKEIILAGAYCVGIPGVIAIKIVRVGVADGNLDVHGSMSVLRTNS